jgi:hypothetical protein
VKCPFCRNTLTVYIDVEQTIFTCQIEPCRQNDIAAYEEVFRNYPTILIKRNIKIGSFYLQIDYIRKKTQISTLHSFFLMDTVVMDRLLDFDRNAPLRLLPKIKNLMALA